MDLSALPVAANLLIFVAAGVAVWFAGGRLAQQVDELAAMTRAGQAFLGALVLGGLTSLPEAATMITASAIGNPQMALGNLFGSIAANVVILSAADLASRSPLASTIDRRAPIRQGLAVLLLLGVTTAAILFDDPVDARIGLWPVVLFVLVVAAFVVLQRTDPERTTPDAPAGDQDRSELPGVVRAVALTAVVIVGAGYVSAISADAFAAQIGLGGGFVGFVLLAGASSLPEISTTVGAIKIGAPGLAAGNVFGTNLVNMTLVLAADVSYDAGPVLDAVGPRGLLTLGIAGAVVAVYLGFLRWPRASVGRMGLGSALAVAVYLTGGVVLVLVG